MNQVTRPSPRPASTTRRAVANKRLLRTPIPRFPPGDERILATPVVIKKLPEPLRRIVGDLSEQEKVLIGLDLKES